MRGRAKRDGERRRMEIVTRLWMRASMKPMVCETPRERNEGERHGRGPTAEIAHARGPRREEKETERERGRKKREKKRKERKRERKKEKEEGETTCLPVS